MKRKAIPKMEMKNLKACWMRSFVCFLLLLSAARAVDVGGMKGLDDERFIRGLRERGHTELAEYFLENFKTDDPLLRLSLLAETQKMRATDEAFTTEQRQKAYLDVLATYRQLLAEAEKAPELHWKLPLWRTDMAEYALGTVLSGRFVYADSFVEFGSPTLEQQRMFAELVSEAAVVMDKAHLEMFTLLGELPRREDFVLEFENTGLWKLMVEEYQELRLPFYKSLAWYYASLLPEPPKAADLAETEAALTRLLSGETLSGGGAVAARGLLARVQAKLGRHEEADKNFEQAASDTAASPFDLFIIQLARASSLAAQSKNAEALAVLDEASQLPVAVESPLLLVMAYDARFRVTKDTGEYQKLFALDAVSSRRAAIEAYVNRRFVERSEAAGGDVEGKSTLEVLALVDAQIQQAAQSEDPKAKAEKQEAAARLLKALLDRGGLEPAVESKVRFQTGFVEYQRKAMPQAITAWLDLVDKLPDQPEARGAAVNSFKVANALYQQNKSSPTVVPLMERATIALLQRFPDADMGGGQTAELHWYTLGAFYRQQERWEEAVRAYGEVKPDHPFHANALYEKLECRFIVWSAGGAADGGANRDQMLREAEAFVTESQRCLGAIDAAPAERRDAMKQMHANSKLIQAQALAAWAMLPPPNATAGEQSRHADPLIGKAVALLEGFEDQYREFPGMIGAMRQQRVNLLILQGKVPEATREVEKLIGESPDQSGPLVQGVLDLLNRQVAELQRTQPNSERIAQFQQVGGKLAADLLAWAKNQDDLKNDPAKLLYFEDVYGRQLVAAGQCDPAIAVYEALRARPFGKKADGEPLTGADKIDVLLGLARAYQCSKTAEAYEKALPLLNKIINLAPDKKSDYFWGAWVTRLQILDAQYDAAEDPASVAQQRVNNIFLAVGQLQKTTDPNLGGPKFKQELMRLRNKNQPK